MRQVVVVLDNIRSLYNVGAFFRTADGAGIAQVICCGITGTPDHPRLKKVSLGAEATVPWSYQESTLAAVLELRQQGYQIIAVEKTTTSTVFTDVTYARRVALIFGSETDGLSNDILNQSDAVVHLPMRGKKESLNVSVVGGVMMYYVTTPPHSR